MSKEYRIVTEEEWKEMQARGTKWLIKRYLPGDNIEIVRDYD